MKNKMRNRIGSFMLCAVLVLGNISANTYAASVYGNNMDTQEISQAESHYDKQEEISEIESDSNQQEKLGEIESANNQQEKLGEIESANNQQEEMSGIMSNDEEQEEMTKIVSKERGQRDNSETVSDNNPEKEFPKEQYHFVEEDSETVEKWLALYCPNGFEDLLTYDAKWWNNLYDYEKDYAKFLLGLIVELSEDVYDEQELSECIKILESGVDAWDFFQGTVFEGLTLEDLKELEKEGKTLEDVADRNDNVRERGIAAYALEEGKRVAKVQVSPTGYSGTGHGTIYRITLGGRPAICISFGKSCRSSYLYKASPGTYRKKVGRLGYFASHANVTGATYVACQIAAWLFIESESLSEINVRSRARAMLNISSETSMDKMLTYVWSFYYSAKSHSSGYYEYYSDNPNAQVLIVTDEVNSIVYNPPAKPIEPTDPTLPELPKEPEIVTISASVEAAYKIEVHKNDWQTGVGLSGCEVKLLEDGAEIATLTTDENGYAEYVVTKEAEFSASYDGVNIMEEEAEASLEEQAEAFVNESYTYSTREMKAPHGYVWEANDKSKTIAGDETAVFHLTNERTLGAVELIKYDTESECGKAQGDAGLDGAVYGIYAAEDIRHQDKKTDVILRKDALVQTAVIGKTPKRNGDGYVLNTDGSRHIANAGGEIAYEDTPGKTLFGDLELGSYYIKEMKPSEGYMLDEVVYPASFTYKNQMVKIESRNEAAKQVDNELTVDDSSTLKSVYSGDYAIKQGIQFVKTSDNAYQTELKPIQGAGFSVYLISELSGVKDGSIVPMGDDWTADDIMTFYDYDFTKEKTASLYKRTGHEEWTEGDKLWLNAGDKANEYFVKEMFTDADGHIVTPELPYGTYVIAETTTPQYHVSAKPFIVYITRDGGVLYTNATKQTVEKMYMPEEGIRYGDHKATKNREGRTLQKQRIINNTITKTYLRILKADKEFAVMPGTYIEAEAFVRGTVLKEGAGYRLKCMTLELSKESLKALNWKFDTAGYMSYYAPNAKEMTGTKERPFRTSFLKRGGVVWDCYITLPQEVPIGTYELEEITAPEGYVVNGSEQSVVDAGAGRINWYEIIDTPCSKAVFTINNGAVYPDGQMGTNKYALTDAYGNLTVTVLQENQEQKGIIEITKHGRQLSGAHEDTETLLDKLKKEPFREIKKAAESANRDLVFEYEDAPVEGANFDIVAVENIYSQELQKNLLEQYHVNTNEYLIHKKGDVVATITTDRNGYGYAAGLYIGKYKIVETIAGLGFVLNTKETAFEITAKEQSVNFDFHTADYENERQKLEIAIEKQDQEEGTPLAGAVYGLYAEEDIMTNIIYNEEAGKWVVRDEPKILYPAKTFIATCMTGGDGRGVFDEDLPLGKYTVRELEAPRGYLTALHDISINGSYESEKGGQNVEKQEYIRTFRNRKTKAFIAKQDLVNHKEIDGAELEIKEIEMDDEGNLKKDIDGNYMTKPVVSWTSQAEETRYFYENVKGYLLEIEDESKLPEGKELLAKNAHLVEGLQLGRVYLLSEQVAPYGYGYAEDILFKLTQEKKDGELTGTVGLYSMDGTAWSRLPQDILVMYDEKKALDIEKSTIQMTQQGDTYRYTIDELSNLTGESLDEFTMTDYLPAEIYLTELWTGTYNESLLYDVEYMTNQSEGWLSWEGGLYTEENHHLLIPDELRTKNEHVTKFRISFGTVGGDFKKIKSPVYMTCVSPEARGIILNEVELTAEHNGKKLRDKDRTETLLYLKSISGYDPSGGGSPLYEVLETEKTITEKETEIFRTRQMTANDSSSETQEEMEIIEDEATPLSRWLEKIGVPTGDDAPIAFFAMLAAFAAMGLAILLFFRRKKKR